MGRIVGWAVAVSLVLALGVAACSSDVDGDDAQAYVDAIAATGRYDDPDDDYDMLLSAEASACYGEAYIEVVGVERLAAEVSPEEIEASPEKEVTDWDVEVTDAEGTEIFRSLVECAPTAMEDVGRSYAEQSGSFDLSVELDASCLAQVDPSAIEDLVGAAIARDDDSVATEEQMGRLVDWMAACGDFRGALLASITSDPSVPKGAAECLDAAIDDESVRVLLVAAAVLQDEASLEESPAVVALMDAIASCEQLAD